MTPKDAIFWDNFDIIRRAPLEANAAALDAALVALFTFIECSDSAIKYF